MRRYVSWPYRPSSSLNASATVGLSLSIESTTFCSSVVEIVRLVDDLGGVGEVVDDAVEQLLDGLVLVGRAHEHRRELQLDRPLADRRLDELLGDPLLEDRLGQLVGEHRRGVEHLLARLGRLRLHLGGDLATR